MSLPNHPERLAHICRIGLQDAPAIADLRRVPADSIAVIIDRPKNRNG
jgi:hypothetical protein